MKIQYKYKNELFDDIRDIVFNNNKFEPDFDYILEEYIPFQVFITGRTFFKGVTVVSDIKYLPENQMPVIVPLDSLISESFKKQYESMSTLPIAAVSGGIDSSIVAAKFQPNLVYTGYYKDGEEYDETPYAAAMANVIGARHIKVKLVEQDFIDNMYKVLDVYCTPIGGLGSVTEYAVLQRVLEKYKEKEVLFGHGGDEIFMAYFFNRFVMNFCDYASLSTEGMVNFWPSLYKGIRNIVDFMIISSINRAGKEIMYSGFVRTKLEPLLSNIEKVIDKILTININWTLPSLLHLNQQMCVSLGVKGYSPIATMDLIKYARALNTPMATIQKEQLRNLPFGVPDVITNNYEKRGFPVPIEVWPNVSKIIEEEYNRFRLESWIPFSLPEFKGVNRFTWGAAQAGMYLNRFFRK